METRRGSPIFFSSYRRLTLSPAITRWAQTLSNSGDGKLRFGGETSHRRSGPTSRDATGCRTGDAASGSVARGLRQRSRSGGRPVERAVHLLERAALGFGTECPEADHAEDEPRCEIDKSRAKHDEV